MSNDITREHTTPSRLAERLYSPKAILYAVAPSNWGALPNPDGRGHANSADDISWIELSIRLEPDASRIQEARFIAAGSPALRAAGSVLCRLLPGLRILEARHVEAAHLEHLLETAPAHRRELLEVPIQALQDCLKQAARQVCCRMERNLRQTWRPLNKRVGSSHRWHPGRDRAAFPAPEAVVHMGQCGS